MCELCFGFGQLLPVMFCCRGEETHLGGAACVRSEGVCSGLPLSAGKEQAQSESEPLNLCGSPRADLAAALPGRF